MIDHNRWDEYLVFEHELIERAMGVLRKCLDDFEDSIANPRQMGRAIDFLLEFGDKIHNQKEESYLFPLMEQRGIPREGGPLGVMVREHRAERDLLGRKLAELPTLAGAGSQEKEHFKNELEEYLRIRAEHIWKENDVLYAMGRKVLSEDDNDLLLTKFTHINQETYGPEAATHYIRMVEEMEKAEHIHTRLVENLSLDQLHAIMETLPFEVTFVDAEDTVAYFNRLDKEKVFVRTRSVIGRKVQKCHPEKSVDVVNEIVEGFKNRTRDRADFWIDFKGDKILIRYFPVYAEDGAYLGVLEVTQEIGWIQELKGQRRLLD